MAAEDERRVKRTIIIDIYGGNDFAVIEGEKMATQLGWDEMLGQVASLTHPVLASNARYRMQTPAEVTGERERHMKLMRLNEAIPNWRLCQHKNGRAMFASDGTMLDESGNRSILDDVDE